MLAKSGNNEAGRRAVRREASRITLAYVLLAGTWIVATDLVFLGDIDLSDLQESIGKGLLFVLVTAVLIQLSIERGMRRTSPISGHLGSSGDQLHSLLEQSIAGFYVLQDGRFAYVNPRFAMLFGHRSPESLMGRDLLSLVAEEDRSRLSAIMLKRLSGEPDGRFEITALHPDNKRVRIGADAMLVTFNGKPAIVGLAQDITEREEQERQIRDYVSQLERAIQGTLEVASKMVELRDPYTSGHQHRVGELCAAIGKELGLGSDVIDGVRVAGSIHDIGKISVPAEILSKPTRLTPFEFEIVKQHAAQGYEILKGMEFPWPIAKTVWQHHERMNGSGYPLGLRHDDICIEARILAVADTLEAMASHRPYRPGLGIDDALREIDANRGRLYDDEVAAACLRLFRDKGYSLAQ